MNLLALARRLNTETGRSGTRPAAVATAQDNDLRIVNAVRDAWLEVQRKPHNWRWMRKTLAAGVLQAGVTSYAATALDAGATNVSRWWQATYDYSPMAWDAAQPTRPWPLRFVPYERFRGAFLDVPGAAGAPQCWSVGNAGELLIGPAPDASYRVKIDYLSTPTELLADADEPDMPTEHHMLLVWLGLRDMAVADGSQERYARGEDKADEMLTALIRSQGAQITFTHRPLA